MKMHLGKLAILVSALLIFPAAPPANAAPANPGKPVLTSATEEGAPNDEAQILVTWTKSGGPSLVGHSVRLSGGGVTIDGQETCVGTTCTANFTDLSGGTQYTATVTAIDSTGALSSPVSSDQFTALASPTITQSRTVQVVDGNLVLSWLEPASTGGSPISSYRISAAGSDFQATTVPGSSTSLQPVGLTPGDIYTFAIVAVNAIGSSPSGNFQASVAPNVPDQPSAPSVNVVGQQVTVEWTAPDNGGDQITGYTVSLYRDGAVVETDDTIPGTVTTKSFVVSANGEYKATVAATNDVGTSPPSALSEAGVIDGATDLPANEITPTTLANRVLAVSQSQAISATSLSGEPVTIRTNSPSICSFSSGQVTALAQGRCSILLTSPSSETYNQQQITINFDVKLSKTISFADIPNQSFPGTLDLTGRVSATAGETVLLTATGNCSKQSAVVFVMDAVGSCTITATSAENTGYFAAPQIQKTFLITGQGGGIAVAPVITPPVVTKRPSLSGDAALGQFLAASPGIWENQVNLDFAYRWFRCDAEITNPNQSQVDSSCQVIENARLIRYQVGPNDAGKHILVEVTAVNILSLRTTTFSSTVFFGTEPVTPATGEPAYWPKKLTDNSIKLYAKNIVGVGKVQFFLNGKEIAWVRAVDESDPKLREANGFYYLVRTVNLKAGQKNAVEIYVDGERVRRAAYTVR